MERTVQQLVLRYAALLLAGVLLTGCATARGPEGEPGGGAASAPGDPLEPINRPIYAFNQAFDRQVAKPVAQGYEAVTPQFVDAGVTNFFNNLDDITVLANSTLQLKGRKAAATTLRLAINTTFGVLGIFDFASRIGIPKENEDFGQTLGYWGVGSGPYLVLPVLGPSTVRDAPGRAVDAQYAPLNEITSNSTEFYGAWVLYGVDTRASLLGATRVIDTAALDPYSYTRDAWLRRRASLVYDGTPPPGAVPGSQPPTDDGFDPFSDEDDDLFKEEPAGGGSGDGGNP